MLLGLGYGCQIRVCVRHEYCSIFVSFSINLKDQTVISMSEYVSDTDVGHGYFRENEKSEQHRVFIYVAACVYQGSVEKNLRFNKKIPSS